MTNRFYLLAFLYAVSIFVTVDALHRALGMEELDCRGGCTGAVVREIPSPARRPYSRENLTNFSYTQPMIPPLQYDYPTNHRVTRIDEQEMKLVCPLPAKGHVTVACAKIRETPCHIYILNDALLKKWGWNHDIVLRHEQAHCNGWAADHPGIELPQKQEAN